jgi:hypothetical protein
MNGFKLAMGAVGALALGAVLGARDENRTSETGSRSTTRQSYKAIRNLGYSESEIERALVAAGQGPTALLQDDRTTQTAGPTRQGLYPGIDFRPPPEVRAEALRGLRIRKEWERRGKRVDPKTGAGPGGWWIGVGRAIQLAVHPAMPPREIPRMCEYFRRHIKDKQSPDFGREDRPTAGFVAWLLWGGDAGRQWATEISRQMAERDAEQRLLSRRGSRALAIRGARLTAELAQQRSGPHRRGSQNRRRATEGLSEPLQRLYDALDLTDAQKAEELVWQGPTWLLWAGLSEGGHKGLADRYEETDYDREDILERIREELGKEWLQHWADKYIPELTREEAVDAPSFVFFDRPTVLRNAWLIHFTNQAKKIVQQGFLFGVADPGRLGLTTHLSKAQKNQPGYVFAFRPQDARHGTKYGREAVLFRADAILAYHNTDQESQAIAWGEEAEDLHEVRKDGGRWILGGDEDEDAESYATLEDLIADLEKKS